MKAVIYDARTEIFPTTEEIHTECKIGEGPNTCIFLTVGSEFECHALNKMPIWSVIERSERGETTAQRQGCERVLNWKMPHFINFSEPVEVEIE